MFALKAARRQGARKQDRHGPVLRRCLTHPQDNGAAVATRPPDGRGSAPHGRRMKICNRRSSCQQDLRRLDHKTHSPKRMGRAGPAPHAMPEPQKPRQQRRQHYHHHHRYHRRRPETDKPWGSAPLGANQKHKDQRREHRGAPAGRLRRKPLGQSRPTPALA